LVRPERASGSAAITSDAAQTASRGAIVAIVSEKFGSRDFWSLRLPQSLKTYQQTLVLRHIPRTQRRRHAQPTLTTSDLTTAGA